MIKKDFKEYFKFPLKIEYMKVYTNDGNMAFDFYFNKNIQGGTKPLVISESLRAELVGTINGTNNKTTEAPLSYKDGIIYHIDREFILMRGWGHLTGRGGGLGLDVEVAMEIQDEFAQYIIDKLNTKT